ncbi:MAG TPA: LLM class flavin-dependent oxidoreductase [Burkholderiales bacterium]|nr:LLM class flavin-dependent oxidoreductase [Burkholderiales bacterium]
MAELPFAFAVAILAYRRKQLLAAFDARVPMGHIRMMRLGIFMMPLHPPQRDPLHTLQEDREAVVLADRLGFHDAFVGEHLTDRCENVTNSFIFLASLISDTKAIRLATGTSNLSQSHPAVIAAHAAMFDHLAKGRFIFGISPGALSSDAEALGILGEDRNRMLAEAIDVILAIWEREPPYEIDFPGNRYKVTTAKTHVPDIGRGVMYKPYQKPRPEIVGTVVAPHSKGVIAMGERDFHPLSANFLLPHWLPSHWANYAEGKRRAGKAPDSSEWRIARTIFVGDDDKVAERYARGDPNSPYRFYWNQLRAKMMLARRHVIFKMHESEDDGAVTIERLLDQLVLCGTVNKVVDQLLALREQVGDFGEIVYAGMDWVDPALARRSMELMATEVVPRLNKAIGAQAGKPRHEAARI